MSGTDELFPDAEQHPGALVPPPPSPPVPVAAAVVSASASPAAPRRGIGVAALIVGALALIGDLIGIVIAVVTFAGAITKTGSTPTNIDDSLGALIGVIIVEFLVFFGGVIFGLLAAILGIVAAVRNRGRVLGVVGAVFGVIVLIGHLSLGIAVATSGNLPGVTS